MYYMNKVIKKLTEAGMSREKAGQLVMKLFEENSYDFLRFQTDLYEDSIKKYNETMK